MQREYLMKASVYSKQIITNHLISEKLDGFSAFWDGGVSTGMLARDVPYANTEKDKRDHLSTGLFSSHGKVIHAPKDFINELKKYPFPLQGELWLGWGRFQKLASIVREFEPGPGWIDVKFVIYDSPSVEFMFQAPDLSLKTNQKFAFIKQGSVDWWRQRSNGFSFLKPYGALYELLKTKLPEGNFFNDYAHGEPIFLLSQEELKGKLIDARRQVEDFTNTIYTMGGEGSIIRSKKALWFPGRSKNVLKYKPFLDDEAVLVGFEPGKGKHEGKIGSLRLEKRTPTGIIVFNVSGLTDEERMGGFKLGDIITYKYRELTTNGVPKEARYLRKSIGF